MIAQLKFQSEGEAQARKEIVLYGLSFCDHCHDGRRYLSSRGERFSFTFLDEAPAPVRAAATARFRKAYGKKLIYPVLEIDGELHFGFDADRWAELLDE